MIALAAQALARDPFHYSDGLLGEVTASRLFLSAALFPIGWAFADRSLPSPSPDFPVTLLTILALALVARSFETPREAGALPAALMLALFAVTVKLSAAPLLLGVLLVLAVREGLRPLAALAAPALFLLIPWAARGVAVTGYALYPLASTRIQAAGWAVPRSLAEEDAVRIRSWARRPTPPLQASIPFREWAGPWLRRNLRVFAWPPAAPGAYGILFLASLPILLVRPRSRAGGSPLVPWLIACGGLAFWFAAAPDPRFALGLLYGFALFPASVALVRLGFTGWTPGARASFMVSAITLVLLGIGAAELLRAGKGRAPSPGLLTPPPSPVPGTVVRRASDGLEVLVPVRGEQCWNAPLPCTPVFRPDLRAERDASGRVREFRSGSP